MAFKRVIAFRPDTALNWYNYNPILSIGEGATESDTGVVKVGDGSTPYNDLPEVINSVENNTYNYDSGWLIDTTFAKDQIVGYDGQVYISLQDNNLGNQPDISSDYWIEYTNALSNDVPMFRVALSADAYAADDTAWIWDVVHENNGNCYSSVTGAFTAPQAGYYYFSTSIRLNVAGRFDYFKNDVPMNTSGISTDEGIYDVLNAAINAPMTVWLELGDIIDLRPVTGAGTLNSDCFWTGFLVGGAKGQKGDAGIGTPWSAGTTFTIDAVVSYGDTLYKSLQAGNLNNLPDEVDSLYWKLAYITTSDSINTALFQRVDDNTINDGPAITAGYNVVPLNTVDHNTIPGCSFDETLHQVTLPAGKYRAEAYAYLFYPNGYDFYLKSVSTGLPVVLGKPGYADQGTPYVDAMAYLMGIIEISTEQVFELVVTAETATVYGFGWSGVASDTTLDSAYQSLMFTDLKSLKGEKGDQGIPGTTGSGADGGFSTPVGAIVPWPSSIVPAGYLACDGSEYSRVTYSDLFSVIGDDYGIGDGLFTFNVPDYRAMFLRGSGEHGSLLKANGTAYDGGLVGAESLDSFQGHEHDYWRDLRTSSNITDDIASSNVDFGHLATVTEGVVEKLGYGTPRVGLETQPANVSVNWIIRATNTAVILESVTSDTIADLTVTNSIDIQCDWNITTANVEDLNITGNHPDVLGTDLTTLFESEDTRVYNGTITMSEQYTNFEQIIVKGSYYTTPFVKTFRYFPTALLETGSLYDLWEIRTSYAQWYLTTPLLWTFYAESGSWIRGIYGIGRKIAL